MVRHDTQGHSSREGVGSIACHFESSVSQQFAIQRLKLEPTCNGKGNLLPLALDSPTLFNCSFCDISKWLTQGCHDCHDFDKAVCFYMRTS